MINDKRIRIIRNSGGPSAAGPVVYWMSRDQRAYDNWALLFALQKGAELKRQVVVVFNLVTEFLGAGLRQYDFMLKGLQQTERHLRELNIPFFLLTGNPTNNIPRFMEDMKASCLITDSDPLKIKRVWKHQIAAKSDIDFYEVDAHNIVPVFYVSQKEEFAAYTLRPKINKHLEEFLTEMPEPPVQKLNGISAGDINWSEIYKQLRVDDSIKEAGWITPGAEAAHQRLHNFILHDLEQYNSDRNDPVKDGQSNLSPYLHFGQISSQRIALEVKRTSGNPESEKAFLEELIVRKELSDNYCLYNPNYDTFEGFKEWAKKTLLKHSNDKREFLYTKDEFEGALTHEDLWNAAQVELIMTGKIHGYMRMYWAKKILEWSASPAEALDTAVYLNDKYALDGRDPNGYTGCAWAIGGVHDRPWMEREIFGQIRYMNYNGAKRKFDTGAYIKRFAE